jgi:hypothetical protein
MAARRQQRRLAAGCRTKIDDSTARVQCHVVEYRRRSGILYDRLHQPQRLPQFAGVDSQRGRGQRHPVSPDTGCP